MDISGSLNTAANFSSIETRLDQLEETVKAQDARIKKLEEDAAREKEKFNQSVRNSSAAGIDPLS